MKEEKKESTFDKKKYDLDYAKKNLKRIPFDVPIEDYIILQRLANESTESISTYIKIAISERAERERDTEIFSKYRKKKMKGDA